MGSVDALGDLEDAVKIAARMADLEEYRLTELPQPKDAIQEFIEYFANVEDVRTRSMLKKELGQHYSQYQFIQELHRSNGMQTRLPFIIPFK